MCVPAMPAAPVEQLHSKFVTLMPKIESCVTVYFRDVRCPATKADCIAEAVALAWAWFCRLAQRGKDAAGFVTVLASYAARAVCCGRRVCGQERARDVLSPVAQKKHNFSVGCLPDFSSLEGNIWDEALTDNTQSDVVDQVCFRLDFPRWRRSHTERDRRVIDDLIIGSRTQEVARRFGLTESRISQLRRAFADDWKQFCGDGAEEEQTPFQAERRR